MKPLILRNIVTHDFCRKFVERPHEQLERARVGKGEDVDSSVATFRRCWTQVVTDEEIVKETVVPIFAQYPDIDTDGKTESCLILYRDKDAGNYDLHQDVFYSENVRKLSMSLMLSDHRSFTGGVLEIMGQPIDLQWGDAVVFPSFLPHLVTPVKTGERLVLVSWMYGPQWK